jgi:hypothetical protein
MLLVSVKGLLDTLTQKLLEKPMRRVLDHSLVKTKIIIVFLRCLVPRKRITLS